MPAAVPAPSYYQPQVIAAALQVAMAPASWHFMDSVPEAASCKAVGALRFSCRVTFDLPDGPSSSQKFTVTIGWPSCRPKSFEDLSGRVTIQRTCLTYGPSA